MSGRPYDLFCVAVDPHGERGYRGPFETREEAERWSDEHAAEGMAAILSGRREAAGGVPHSRPPVLRCRRENPVALLRSTTLDELVEIWDEQAVEGLFDGWADWDEPIVRLKPGAEEAFRAFVSKYVIIDCFDNEEPRCHACGGTKLRADTSGEVDCVSCGAKIEPGRP